MASKTVSPGAKRLERLYLQLRVGQSCAGAELRHETVHSPSLAVEAIPLSAAPCCSDHMTKMGKVVTDCPNPHQLSDARLLDLRRTLWDHGVVVIKTGRVLQASELESFARRAFGDELIQLPLKRDETLPAFLSAPEAYSAYVAPMGNPRGLEPLTEPFDPERRVGAQCWHADRDVLPSWGRPLDTPYVVMVHVAQNAFPGHSTSFVDMRGAFRNLTVERRGWFERQRGWFLAPFGFTRENAPRVLHPLVHRQPFTGVPSLYVGGGGACFLEGMEGETENCQAAVWRALIEEAVVAAGPGNLYDHVWEDGDLVIWDNTQVLHRANPYDKSRYVRTALRLGVVSDRKKVV